MAKPEVGATEAERLILSEKVSAILGAWNSVITMSSSTVSEKYKIPYVVMCSILDDITERGYKYLFRHTANTTMIAKGEVAFLKAMSEKGPRIKKVAFVYDFLYKNIMLGIRDIVTKETDFAIVVEEAFSPGQLDMTPMVLKMKGTNPDVILAGITGPGDAILFFRTLHETNLNVMGILGSGAAFVYEPTLTGAGKLANYTLSQDPWTPRMPVPAMQNFLNNFRKRHKADPNPSTTEAYSVTYVLAEALERAGSVKPEDIRNALANLDINLKDRNHPAVIASGYRVKFGPDGQNPYIVTAIEQVFDQKTTTVYPPEVAERPPAWPVPAWDKR
jgi:branched-chain amino acid transport system substrate-binding protein